MIQRTSGALRNNPILVRGLALPFAVIPSITLKNGVAMCLIMVASTLPAALVARLLDRGLPAWLRMPVYSMVSMGCVLGALSWLGRDPVLVGALGIYIPLAAVNTIMTTSALEGHNRPFGRVLFEAVMTCVGFSIVICGVAALREILAGHTLWGMPLVLYPLKIEAAALPFFGFILLGFLAALFRTLDRSLIRLMLALEKRRHKEAVR